MTVLSAGLWLNALAPAGYMIALSSNGWPTIQICPETHPLAQQVDPAAGRKSMDHAANEHSAMDHAAMGHEDDSGSSASQTTDCAFAGLTKLATGPVDPFVLALAVAFALLLGLAPRAPLRLPKLAHLRPPLRGPPSFA